MVLGTMIIYKITRGRDFQD